MNSIALCLDSAVVIYYIIKMGYWFLCVESSGLCMDCITGLCVLHYMKNKLKLTVSGAHTAVCPKNEDRCLAVHLFSDLDRVCV